MNPIRRILVATDFGEPAAAALEEAVELARTFDAELVVAHAWEVPAYAYVGFSEVVADLTTPIETAAKESLKAVVEAVRPRVRAVHGVLRHGPAAEAMVEIAHEVGADLIVIGTHGRGGLPRLFLGSVAERVVRMAPVPVLVAHQEAPPRAA